MMKTESAADRMAKGKRLASHRVTAKERIAGCAPQRGHNVREMETHMAMTDRKFEANKTDPKMTTFDAAKYHNRGR